MPGDFAYPFRQARWYSSGRSGYSTLWIVWHATDDDESPTYAEGLGNYFATTDRQVSTHFGVDSNSVVQYVRLADTAYGAGEPSNLRGIHIEHSGRSTQTRPQWLDAFGQGMLAQSARLNVTLLKRTGIVFTGRFLTDSELRARKPGITRHMDLVRVFGGSHDRCPSPAFPADVLFGKIADLLGGTTPGESEDDDMPTVKEVWETPLSVKGLGSFAPINVLMELYLRSAGRGVLLQTSQDVTGVQGTADSITSDVGDVQSSANAIGIDIEAIKKRMDTFPAPGPAVQIDYDKLADAVAARMDTDLADRLAGRIAKHLSKK